MYYAIKNKDDKYITRRSVYSDLSLTDNKNFAYTYELKVEAEAIVTYLKEIWLEDLEVVEFKYEPYVSK